MFCEKSEQMECRNVPVTVHRVLSDNDGIQHGCQYTSDDALSTSNYCLISHQMTHSNITTSSHCSDEEVNDGRLERGVEQLAMVTAAAAAEVGVM